MVAFFSEFVHGYGQRNAIPHYAGVFETYRI
jgi:hypothetical protein